MREEQGRYIPALGFDWLTSIYDPVVRITTRELSFKTALIEQAKLETHHRILDLGCGTGTLAILIKKTEPMAEVVGIDGDPRILKIAKRKAVASNVELTFDEGLSFTLPYSDGSFDRVFSSLFFHHLMRADKVRTLHEVRRVLKSDGQMHIGDWGKPEGFLMRIASGGIQLLDGLETTGDNLKGLLASLVVESGFRATEETLHFNTLFGTIRLLKSAR